MPDELTVETVAERLGVHPETIRRWLTAGRIQGYRLGGRKAGWRIAPSEVERLKREGANDG